ncbi:MAG: serine/threonine protein kinase [Oscillospiraceae bacterium]|nr:serine/threonine protein kinase [Oscillospiraceae bacterium]
MNGQYNLGDEVLSKWNLVRSIGEGSHGRVFEAERNGFGQVYKAAIKIITIPQNPGEIKSVMSDGMTENNVIAYFTNFVEELVEEFSLMSKLKGNSNIVSCEDHDVVAHEDRIGWDIIIRMELLTPLLDYAQSRTLTRKDIMQMGIDLCKALELCQRYNIIHRDIKPENIFVSDTGDFKLGDFGTARTMEKTTGGLSKKGTYTYMAPEMYRGESYGSNVDIYSLGIVLYRLLNENRTPFLPNYPEKITHNDKEIANAKRMTGVQMPAPKNADGRLSEIVLKACSYSPAERYSSPRQMREELEALLYNVAEKPVIYPLGDETPLKSLGYVEDNVTLLNLDEGSGANEPTESLLWSERQQEVVPVDFAQQTNEPTDNGEEQKTQSVVGRLSFLSNKKRIGTALKIGGPIAAVLVIAMLIFGLNIFGTGDTEPPAQDAAAVFAGEPYSPEEEVVPVVYDDDNNAADSYTYEHEPYDQDDGREYDELGRLIAEIITDDDGIVTGLLRFEYHCETGIKSSKVEYFACGLVARRTLFHEDGTLCHWWEAEHDDNDNRVLSARFNENGIIEISHAFEFDEYDRLSGKSNRWFDEDGALKRAEVYELFESGETKVKSYFDFSDGYELLRSVHEFDEGGSLIKQTDFDSDGSADAREFDVFGNVTQQTILDSRGNQRSRVVNTYNAAGTLLISVQEFSGANVRTRTTEYTYNNAGAATARRIQEFNNNGSVRRTRNYRMNSRGGWELVPVATTPRAPQTNAAAPEEQPGSVQTPQGCQDSRHGQGAVRPLSRRYDERNLVVSETFQYFCGCKFDRIFERNASGAIIRTFTRAH